jgi:hypothetical protein
MTDPNEYHFITTWRVEGTAGEVADVLRDPLDLARWWPAVYLDVHELAPPDSRGLHQRVRLRTKGWLPYTLRWDLEVVESRYPERFALEATGDLVGCGIWTIVQEGPYVTATYDWRVRADRPLLQRLAPILRPLLESNHRWAMAQGKESLELELARRRASTPESRRSVPPPPGPVTYAAVTLIAGVALVGGGLTYLIARSTRTRKSRASSSRTKEKSSA